MASGVPTKTLKTRFCILLCADAAARVLASFIKPRLQSLHLSRGDGPLCPRREGAAASLDKAAALNLPVDSLWARLCLLNVLGAPRLFERAPYIKSGFASECDQQLQHRSLYSLFL